MSITAIEIEPMRDVPPDLVYASPEEIVATERLTRAQKIDLLRSREYDAAELAVAEEEGMQGPENDQLPRILNALARLTGGDDAEYVAPTKQHALS